MAVQTQGSVRSAIAMKRAPAHRLLSKTVGLLMLLSALFAVSAGAESVPPVVTVAPEAGAEKAFSAVASTPSGELIVVWQQPDSPTFPSEGAIRAARYRADGSPIGAAFNVSQRPARFARPAVAADDAGNFVVAWEDASQTSGYRLLARRFDRGGQALAEEIVIDAQVGLIGSAGDLDIDCNGAGEFAVVWSQRSQLSAGYSGLRTTSVRLRRYHASGAARGLVQVVDSGTDTEGLFGDVDYGEVAGRVAIAADASTIVAWLHDDREGTAVVFAQRFGPQGLRQGPAFRVSSEGTYVTRRNGLGTAVSYTSYGKSDADIAVDGAGRFTLTWLGSTRLGDADHREGLFMRRYGADGQPLGDEQLIVPRGSSFDLLSPRIAMNAAGQSVVAWVILNLGPAPGSRRISWTTAALRFDGNGIDSGAVLTLSPDSAAPLSSLAVAFRAPAGFAASWTAAGAAYEPLGQIKLVSCCSP